jgi:serine/threonine protein kinase
VSDSWIGKIVGNCRIEQKIGEGGCGAVYRGVDLMLERPVAVKVLHGGMAARRDVAERFRSEAHTLARLSHPNVATLYSFHREEDTYLMVMEFVEGRTFDELIREHGYLRQGRAIPLFCQALDGIHHAHQAGVIHRDLKGSNVMRNAQGVVKVMDFGIARALWSPELTQADHPLGTPEYMSPEQVRGEEIDARADIYSLGVLLFKMLTGRLPFSGDSPYDIMRAQVDQMPPSVRDHVPEIASEVDEVILRALAKDRSERFESAGALRCALEEAHGKVDDPDFMPATPSPAPLLASPDAHTTPIPLEDLADVGAAALLERYEGPTHIVRYDEPGSSRDGGWWVRARALGASLRPKGLTPLVSVPGLSGLVLGVALLGLGGLRSETPATHTLESPPQSPALERPAAAEGEGPEEPPQIASLEKPDETPAPKVVESPASRPAPPARRSPRPRTEPSPREEGTGWIIRRQ